MLSGPSPPPRTHRGTTPPRGSHRRDGSRRTAPSSRREPLERAPPQQRELQRKPRVSVLQIRAGELGNATQALADGVPVEIEIAHYGIQAAVEAQVRIERADEVRVLLAVGQRAEGSIGELAD